MNWAEISAAASALGAVYVAVRRVVVHQNQAVRKMIQSECKGLSVQIDTLEDNYKTLNARLDSVMKSIGELKAHQASTRTALEDVHGEIKKAIIENTSALKEVQKSKVEWITNELAVIKGKKN